MILSKIVCLRSGPLLQTSLTQQEAKQMCNVQAFQMKRALDQSPPNLMEGDFSSPFSILALFQLTS